MVVIKRDVAYTASYGCWFCLHVGSVAIYLGRGVKGSGPRLEIMTPRHWFRWSKGYRDARCSSDRRRTKTTGGGTAAASGHNHATD